MRPCLIRCFSVVDLPFTPQGPSLVLAARLRMVAFACHLAMPASSSLLCRNIPRPEHGSEYREERRLLVVCAAMPVAHVVCAATGAQAGTILAAMETMALAIVATRCAAFVSASEKEDMRSLPGNTRRRRRRLMLTGATRQTGNGFTQAHVSASKATGIIQAASCRNPVCVARRGWRLSGHSGRWRDWQRRGRLRTSGR